MPFLYRDFSLWGHSYTVSGVGAWTCFSNYLEKLDEIHRAKRTIVSLFETTSLVFSPVWYDRLWALGRWLDNHVTKNKNAQVLAQLVLDQTLGVVIFFPLYFYAYELSEALVALRGTSL